MYTTSLRNLSFKSGILRNALTKRLIQWASLNSASKYVKEFDPINGPLLSSASKYGEELGPIQRDSQLSRGRIKQGPLHHVVDVFTVQQEQEIHGFFHIRDHVHHGITID